MFIKPYDSGVKFMVRVMVTVKDRRKRVRVGLQKRPPPAARKVWVLTLIKHTAIFSAGEVAKLKLRILQRFNESRSFDHNRNPALPEGALY